MMILVTGGAGYIGSIVVERLLAEGAEVVVFDNLQEGHGAAVLPEAVFIQGDLTDREAIDQAFKAYTIEAVLHLAAEANVPLSMTDPSLYFRVNLIGGFNLLEAMRRHGVSRMVFSSTAAVYGEPKFIPITEDHPENPINPYGESKLLFERMLEWYHHAYGLKYITFRYFNAAGASERLGEDHKRESHLIPLVLQVALGQREYVEVFGSDYPTRDGTCIRDYVHVVDLADAHIRALEHMDRVGKAIYNLGNGPGYSVLEVIEAARRVTGHPIPIVMADRRPGDPAVLVASSDRIQLELGWKPRFPDLETILRSAWEWHRKHPYGHDKVG